MQKFQELENILKNIEGKVLLIDHAYSDLDGMASKYAWSYILREKFSIDSDIAYSKELGHHKTQAMLKKLESFYSKQVNKLEDLSLDDYELIMLLDVNQSSTNLPFTEAQVAKLDYGKVAVIDHHEKKDDAEEVLFEDITTDIGATVIRTIEYMDYFKSNLLPDNEEHVMLATSLWLGYLTDVRAKGRTKRDYQALSLIIESANIHMQQEIERGARPELAQRALGKALAEYQKIGPYAIAYAGEIKKEHKDIIAIIAEELLKGQGVEASIAWAMLDGKPQGSIRTEESSHLSAPKIAQWFGGNGRTNAAGFSADFGFLSDYEEEDKQTLIDLVHKKIVNTIKSKEED
ncbi:hypothetical protein D6777_04675 [Candidatus Woesearchaeota archaeon]|nr:MAG: hypothetical protein D6777_04675 [Candidatus Woesearchaeota archaeon]